MTKSDIVYNKLIFYQAFSINASIKIRRNFWSFGIK
jgi:hypothetical protein